MAPPWLVGSQQTESAKGGDQEFVLREQDLGHELTYSITHVSQGRDVLQMRPGVDQRGALLGWCQVGQIEEGV